MKFRYIVTIGLALVASPISYLPVNAADTVKENIDQSDPVSLRDVLKQRSKGPIKRFYAGRDFQPLWVEKGVTGASAKLLLRYLDQAALDGLKSSRYNSERLRETIARTSAHDADSQARTEIALSQAFARYVRDVRRVKDIGMEYADPRLKPEKLSVERVLRSASHARSFSDYMQSMGWMSPHYVQIRGMLETAINQKLDDHVIQTIRLNLERARHLPPPSVRHIVVDAASARLWYYQAGKEVGTMRVIVGAKETQTPLLAGSLNYAILNPYWNIPDYLVRDNVARKVLSGRALPSMNMEALSDWSASPSKIDPVLVNWTAVAAGEQEVRVRELPGPRNSMGKVKFVFPNDHGIYLHDTPTRALFDKDDRHLSNGCIRLEKAWALGKWMMGKPLDDRAKATEPELAIPMAAPVPVYLTYLTVMPTKNGVGIRPDIYGLDSRTPD